MNRTKAWIKVHEEFTHVCLERRIQALEADRLRVLSAYAALLASKVVLKK